MEVIGRGSEARGTEVDMGQGSRSLASLRLVGMMPSARIVFGKQRYTCASPYILMLYFSASLVFHSSMLMRWLLNQIVSRLAG